MPSSSARCAQLPRAMDKVPFYTALKKFRDYLNGLIPEIDDSEVVFNDPKIRAADDGTEISDHLKGKLIFFYFFFLPPFLPPADVDDDDDDADDDDL